ncbi:MAG: hypothetical protein JXM71_05500 [Spirochaetales bacterium]|nr:hypothetical protein [Spirochaetales bacterium]
MRTPILLLAATLLASPLFCQTASYDAGDLSDRLSRTVSLTDTFFGRFDRLVGSYSGGGGYDDGIISVNGVWYDGYGIETDFGDQSGVLGRVYGDLFLPVAGDNIALLFGLGGYRYGVFLTGIDMPLPSDDPLDRDSITVTDFTGTQYFQDVYAAALAVRQAGAITVYYATNSLYAPREGVLDFQAPLSTTGYAGARASVLGFLRGEALFSEDMAFQRAGGGLDPVGLVDTLLGTELGQALVAKAGVLWRSFRTADSSVIPFDPRKFLAPASAGLRLGEALRLEGGAVMCSPALRDELGTWLRTAWGGARLAPHGGAVSAGLSASWHSDPRLSAFSGGQSSAIGAAADVSVQIEGFGLQLGARHNYYADIDDLIESYGHWVFFGNLYWSAWL